MFKVLDKVQKMEQAGENIIHFEIGDPDFNTPRNIIEATYESMKSGETHYTSSMGLYDMRVARAKRRPIPEARPVSRTGARHPRGEHDNISCDKLPRKQRGGSHRA